MRLFTHKRALGRLFVVIHVLSAGISFPAAAEAIKESPFEITHQQQGKCVIVTASAPSKATKEAAVELNYWLKRIAGVSLPVITAEEWDGVTPYIAVGASSLTKSNGWETGDLPTEGARVIIEPRRIGLLGNDVAPEPGTASPGTYYAVLEFVRNSLGVRWIWPGELGEVFEPQPTLSVKPGSWQWSPSLKLIRSMRNGYASWILKRLEAAQVPLAVDQNGWKNLGAQQARWIKRERMNRPTSIRFGHTFTKWWSAYSDAHPDWFARPPAGMSQQPPAGVKLNVSNPEVVEKIFRDWHEAWTTDPAANRFLGVSPNDGAGFCTRPETRAWDAPAMKHFSDEEIWKSGTNDAVILSDRYVRFWNLIARKVKASDPNAKVVSIAYSRYRHPPLVEKLEDNLIIAYTESGFGGLYGNADYLIPEWNGWRDAGATEMLWRPNLLFAGHGIPYLYSRKVYREFREFQGKGLAGTDFDSLLGNWSTQGLNYYVIGEMHSRPEASYEEIVGEFYNAFGPAAEAIREYHEFFEKVSGTAREVQERFELLPKGAITGDHVRLVPLLLTPEVLQTGDTLLRKAEAAVQNADTRVQQRVAFIRTGFEHSRLMADTFRKIELHDRTKSASSFQYRDQLKPLWKARKALLTDLAVPAAYLTFREQHNHKLWDAFISPEESGQGTIIPITDEWKIRIDPTDEGRKESWFNADGKSPEWHPASVAMPWREALQASPTPLSDANSAVVWYRVEFKIPTEAHLDDIELKRLRFGSIDHEVQIWLNGKLVAQREINHEGNPYSWNAPFYVDITASGRHEAVNTLVLRVKSSTKNAGVTGPVTLHLH